MFTLNTSLAAPGSKIRELQLVIFHRAPSFILDSFPKTLLLQKDVKDLQPEKFEVSRTVLTVLILHLILSTFSLTVQATFQTHYLTLKLDIVKCNVGMERMMRGAGSRGDIGRLCPSCLLL